MIQMMKNRKIKKNIIWLIFILISFILIGEVIAKNNFFNNKRKKIFKKISKILEKVNSKNKFRANLITVRPKFSLNETSAVIDTNIAVFEIVILKCTNLEVTNYVKNEIYSKIGFKSNIILQLDFTNKWKTSGEVEKNIIDPDIPKGYNNVNVK